MTPAIYLYMESLQENLNHLYDKLVKLRHGNQHRIWPRRIDK